MALPAVDLALGHYRDRARLVTATEQALASIWAEVNPNRIADSWANLLPEAVGVVSGAQLAAARPAASYVDEVLAEQDVPTTAVAEPDPAAFAGQASDARGLIGLLSNPVVVTLLTIQDGFDVANALRSGRSNLTMLGATQVADAGRLADQVAIASRPAAGGYVRMAVGNTCARCLILAGTHYEWNKGFQRHPKCFPAGVVVSGPAALAASRRWYEGELVVLATASGQKLALTGNHPVLTRRGWVPARLLNEADEVVRSTSTEGAAPLVVPDHHEVPALIEDVWRSFAVTGFHRMPSAPEDFHGDGQGGEVDVVYANGALGGRLQASIGQQLREPGLGRRVVGPAEFGRQRAAQLLGLRDAAHAGGPVGCDGLGPAFAVAQAGVADDAGFRWTAPLNTGGRQDCRYWSTGNAVLLGETVLAGPGPVGGHNLLSRQAPVTPRWDAPGDPFSVESADGYAARGRDLLQRLTGQVELDRLVEVRRVEWSGHVYSLTSMEGWHSANSLIVSNCDCIHIPAGSPNAALVRDPRRIYDRMTTAERTRAGFTRVDQRAISDGADLAQVVNAKRGMYVAGGQKLTTEGTTRSGLFRRFEVDPATGKLRARPKGANRPRLSVDEIYRFAGDDRDEAIRLLGEYSYLRIGVPAPRIRPTVEPVRLSTPGPAGAAGEARTFTIRPSLLDAKTTAEVGDALRREFASITGRDLSHVEFRGSVETAREHAEGLLRGAERFPDVRLSAVDAMDDGRAVYAEAFGSAIRFNDRWTTTRRDYLDATANDVATHFHPRGTGNPLAVAVHEFGHVLDINTLGMAIRPDLARLVRRRAAETGEHVDDLVMREVSHYAARSRDELVAEAFLDVMVNGDAAARLSREVFDLLEAEYRRGGRRVGVARVVDSEPNLANLKVAELRALARERAITVPARATKADLVKALTQPTDANALRRAAARERQAAIDTATSRADVLAGLDELLSKSAPAKALAEMVDQAVTSKAFTAADITALKRAAADPAKAQAVLDRISKKYGLTGVARAGDITTMRDGFEVVGGRALAPGTDVKVVRRGVELVRNGETIVLSRPLVREVTKAELAKVRKAAIDEAKAFLDRTAKPTAVQLRKAGVTKVGTVSKTKTVAFDPKLYEVRGAALAAGAKVRVVEPGYSFAYRGETIVLRKPVVEAIPEPPLRRPTGGLRSQTDMRKIYRVDDPETGLRARVESIDKLPPDERLYGSPNVDPGSAGGWTRVHTSITHREVEADGTHWYDVGQLVVDISPDGKTIWHSIGIDEELQGQGFTTRHLSRIFGEYQRLGVERILLEANNEVGGYAWARVGFRFADGAARQELATYARRYAATAGRRLSQSVVDEIERVASNPFAEPIDFAMIGHTGGSRMWPGKEMLLGSHWRGVMVL